jgi:hypothetical protein
MTPTGDKENLQPEQEREKWKRFEKEIDGVELT